MAAKSERVNPSLLSSDVDLVQRTKNALGPSFARGQNLDDFLRVLMPSDIRDDRDLGCGIRQLRMALYGGYTTIWINVAAANNKVVALECTQSTSSDTWSQISNDLQKAWGVNPVKRDERSLTLVSYIDRKIVDEATVRQLGGFKITAAPGAQLDEPYALLTSPLEACDVGEACYIDGVKPAGRKAIEKLIESGRHDLIRAVLRGPSPEGRAYAALALNSGKLATPEDVAVQEKLKKMNVKIHVCHGCIVSTQSFAEVIAEKH